MSRLFLLCLLRVAGGRAVKPSPATLATGPSLDEARPVASFQAFHHTAPAGDLRGLPLSHDASMARSLFRHAAPTAAFEAGRC